MSSMNTIGSMMARTQHAVPLAVTLTGTFSRSTYGDFSIALFKTTGAGNSIKANKTIKIGYLVGGGGDRQVMTHHM
jgi:hypothetical protein